MTFKPLDFSSDFGTPAGLELHVSRGWMLIPGDSDNVANVRIGAVDYPKRFETYVKFENDFACIVLFLADESAATIRIAAVLSPYADTNEAITRLEDARPLNWWKQHALLALVLSGSSVRPEDAQEFFGATYGMSLEDAQEQTAEWLAERVRKDKATKPSRRRNVRMTDELADEVGRVYYEVWLKGGNPTQAVAEYFDKPYSTASRWVTEARKRGFLGTLEGDPSAASVDN